MKNEFEFITSRGANSLIPANTQRKGNLMMSKGTM